MKCASFCVSVVLVCLAAIVLAANVQYRFSSVGNYPGAAYSIPLGDNLTQIVGYYLSATNLDGYIETSEKGVPPVFLGLLPPGSGVSYAFGINVHGVAVGGFCDPAGCNALAAQHGFTYDNGVYTTIDYPQTGATTAAYGINDLGEIVGGFCSGPFPCPEGAFARTAHGFLDDQGAFAQLDYPGSQDTQADAINNAGVIVGAYDINNSGPHGFIHQNGMFKNIDVPGGSFTYPTAINNKGVVAGYYQTPDFNVHGFLYRNGAFETVDYPNTIGTGLSGINDDNVIVGNWAAPKGQRLTFIGIPVR
jgi:probable HAF family extracellular repeat protein